MKPDHTAPECALAIYAHPDDAEISAGGTLAKWAATGCAVHILLTAQGDKGSTDPAVETKQLARLRSEEAHRAAEVLGAESLTQLGYPDGELSEGEQLRGEITLHIRKLRPDVVMCPDPTAVIFGDSYINHRDHRVTGWAALDALTPSSGNPHYFSDQLSGNVQPYTAQHVYLSGTLEPNCAVDISDFFEHKVKALRCHETQLGATEEWLEDFLRQRGEEAGKNAGVRYAESFRRVSIPRGEL